jgi:hypothetical protein
MDKGAEKTGVIETLSANALPCFLAKNFGIKPKPPYYIKLIALGVIIKTGKACPVPTNMIKHR